MPRIDQFKKKILLKITGELLSDTAINNSYDALLSIINQIKELQSTHQFGIVIGGGNLFRGRRDASRLHISAQAGHQIGMISTIINGIRIHDVLQSEGLDAVHMCALFCPQLAIPFNPIELATIIEKEQLIVFSGGTGNPFFTTDTTAMLRGLQIGADEIWKATLIDGVYTKDPRTSPEAQLLKKISYAFALENRLEIMDATAFAFGQQYSQRLRVFNINEQNALLKAAHNSEFGSLIS